jgi:Insertion element 4 transposase N-terminal/Transposase DDE domain
MGRPHLRRFDVSEIGLGVLAEAFPEEKIQAALIATGRQSKRKRQLPAAMMTYYVIALGLFVSVGCREVLRLLLEGAKWIWPYEVRVSTESAITQARQRLGSEPIEQLYREVVRPLAKKILRGAWYRRWRVVTLDGTTFDVADSEANEETFGRPGSSRGGSSFPQVRMVGLVENGTHVLFGAEMSGCRTAEETLARKVFASLRPNMLCLADRNFFGYELWQQAHATGAALVWRLRSNINVVKTKQLTDGSHLGQIYPSQRHAKRGEGGVVVRVIEYRIDGYGKTDIETAELSFVHTLRGVHRKLPWLIASPPRHSSRIAAPVLSEALEERVRRRPGRHYPRGVKRKMSSFHIVTKALRREQFRLQPLPWVDLT